MAARVNAANEQTREQTHQWLGVRFSSSFSYIIILLSTQFVVAMLWSVVHVRMSRLQMVVYVVGSC